MLKTLLVVSLLTFVPLPALAHKVIASVYPAGAMVEGEIGFSDGNMAASTPVVIADPSGRVLGETVTDAAGMFTFTPTEAVALIFTANLGAGHVARAEMSAEDVGRILGRSPAAPPAAATRAPEGGAGPAVGADPEMMAALLRDELRPLRQEIAAYRESRDLQTILGGFGYIAGIFGLGFYIAARRKLAGA